MKHAPEAYLDQDAAAIAARVTGTTNPELQRGLTRELRPA
jgi:hypothetical protein